MGKKKTTQTSRYKRLRKLQNGGNDLNAYYQNLYNTDNRYGGSEQYNNLSNYNKFSNEQEFGVGLSSESGFDTGLDNFGLDNDTQGGSFGLTEAVGYAGAATNLIGNLSDGNFTGNEAQQTVDDLGNTIGGAYYAGGKAVDELLFNKNDDGTYDSTLESVLSTTLTDPSQIVGQSVNSFSEGNIEQGLNELLLPGLAGYNKQREAENAAGIASTTKKQNERIFESRGIAQERGANLGANANIQSGIADYKTDDKGTALEILGLDNLSLFLDGGYLPQQENGGTIINSYEGQDHKGVNGGIPVDNKGIPSVQSRRNPVALTEDGELNWDGYIFSNSF